MRNQIGEVIDDLGVLTFLVLLDIFLVHLIIRFILSTPPIQFPFLSAHAEFLPTACPPRRGTP